MTDHLTDKVYRFVMKEGLLSEGSPVITAVKVVNLTAAMVSMLSLEAAMIARFCDPAAPLFRAKMIGITGFVICLLVVLLSMLMIIRASKELNRINAA